MDRADLMKEVKALKDRLGDKITIPAHHYQDDEIVAISDFVGDSYKLAVDCANTDSDYIVFCGVRFMAEGAAILGKENQRILMPDLGSGCPMADMIDAEAAQEVFAKISYLASRDVAPVAYMNSYADMKAFCGKHGGAICTSSNAKTIVQTYLEEGKSIFFTPDFNLGINTARELGLKDEDIVKVKRDLSLEGDPEKAKMFIWDGFCIVHKVFSMEDIKTLRARYETIKIISHPECEEEVVKASDLSGSTSQIYHAIKDSPAGSIWGVGTEYHFVARIANECPDKIVLPLRESICRNMSKITLEKLHESLRSIEDYEQGRGDLKYEISVSEEYKENGRIALQKMIDVVEGK